MPTLETDDKGNVKVKFTLPESVTTWRLMGIAHDTNMRIGQLEAEAVAQKKLMIEPNLPRFVRPADKGSIVAVSVTCLNADWVARLVLNC